MTLVHWQQQMATQTPEAKGSSIQCGNQRGFTGRTQPVPLPQNLSYLFQKHKIPQNMASGHGAHFIANELYEQLKTMEPTGFICSVPFRSSWPEQQNGQLQCLLDEMCILIQKTLCGLSLQEEGLRPIDGTMTTSLTNYSPWLTYASHYFTSGIYRVSGPSLAQ